MTTQQQVIGIQRKLIGSDKGQSWNKKKIIWSIVHNYHNESKPYDIELQMVMLSSKRIVRVNQQAKDEQMCSFGYEAKFDISNKLKGYIKQDSLTFQLFINDVSFSSLLKNGPGYQPPKLAGQSNDSWGFEVEKNNQKQKKPLFTSFAPSNSKESTLTRKEVSSIPQQSVEFKKWLSGTTQPLQVCNKQPRQQITKIKQKTISENVSTKIQKKQTEMVIKDTQNELIRILMEEKKRKKQEQERLKLFQS